MKKKQIVSLVLAAAMVGFLVCVGRLWRQRRK